MAGRGVWERRQLQFIGVPFCDGQNLAGSDLAPTAFREAGFAALAAKQGWEVFDDGDLDFESHSDSVARRAERERNVAVYRLWVRHGMPGAFAVFLNKHTGASHEPAGGATGAAAPVATGDPYDNVVNGSLVGAGMKTVYDTVKAAAEKGRFVLNVGGDHSIGAPSVAAMASVHQDLAVIWVDAHADANTPSTSPSLHYHGMPVAHVLGWFARNPRGFEWWPGEECPAPADMSQDPAKRKLFPNTMRGLLAESRFAYIGLRDVDETEAAMLRHSGVHVYTMREVDKFGIAACIKLALTAVDPNGNRPLHLSLDVDSIDPAYAPGTGTLARGGLSYREVHYLAEEVALTRRCVSMDLVEVNPVLDAPQPELAQGMHGDPSCMQLTTATVHLAMEIALSALGRSILSFPSKL